MGDVFEEILIKRRTTGADTAKKIGLAALVVLLVFGGLFVTPLLLLAALLAGAGAWYLIQSMNLEYEYQYVNGDIDIDKIMNKSRRKKAGSYDIANLELLAPVSSHELDTYLKRRDIKIVDYTSGDPQAHVYVAIYNAEKGLQAVRLEQLDEKILKDMRRQAPRKVSRECGVIFGG